MTGGSGRFITIEGPDGSGKTTQVEALARRLRAEGPDEVFREGRAGEIQNPARTADDARGVGARVGEAAGGLESGR